jgi:hypothetical protein
MKRLNAKTFGSYALVSLLTLGAAGARAQERQLPDYPDWGGQPFSGLVPDLKQYFDRTIQIHRQADAQALLALLPPGYQLVPVCIDSGIALPPGRAMIHVQIDHLRSEFADDTPPTFPGKTFGPYARAFVWTPVLDLNRGGEFELFILGTWANLGSVAGEISATKAIIREQSQEIGDALAGTHELDVDVSLLDAGGKVFDIFGGLPNLPAPVRNTTGVFHAEWLLQPGQPAGGVGRAAARVQRDLTATPDTLKLELPGGSMRLPGGALLPIDRDASATCPDALLFEGMVERVQRFGTF